MSATDPTLEAAARRLAAAFDYEAVFDDGYPSLAMYGPDHWRHLVKDVLAPVVAERDNLLATVTELQSALTEARAHIEALHRDRSHDESATVAELRQRCERLTEGLRLAAYYASAPIGTDGSATARLKLVHGYAAEALKEGSAPA